MVAPYNGAPAFFTDGIPDDAPRPALALKTEVVRPFEFRARIGFTVQVRIRALGSREQFDGTTLRGLGWQIYMSLNRRDLGALLDTAGFEDHGCFAEPPVDGPENLPFPECQVVVRCIVLKKP